MLIGYARVSTRDQNPDHQTDALERAGVAAENVYMDKVSGARASRPEWDKARAALRAGDTLVCTRLDRLGRSMKNLVDLGEDLRQRGIGLKVIEQGIDTATSEGKAMFGMFAVFAELQRDLIASNTCDGLEAARARGRKGGRKSKLSAAQITDAQQKYDSREWTVQQIADLYGVPRTTLYNHLNTTTAAKGTA